MAQRPRQLQPYASADAYFGAQLRSWRTRAGLSQADLARQVHVSGDLIGKIEKAQRRAHPRLATDLDAALAADGALTRSAPALRAPDRTRARKPSSATESAVGTQGQMTPTLRPVGLRLLGQAVGALYGSSPGPSFEAQQLAETQAPAGPANSTGLWCGPWRDYQASRFTVAAAGAAAMIPSLEAAVQGPARETPRREAYQALAMTYHVAAATATKLGGNDLAWVCADRGLRAAESSEDPAVIASLLRSVAHVLLSGHRDAEAADVADRAANRLASRLAAAGPVGWSLLGSLHLVAAMALARADDPAGAHAALAQAAQLAELLGVDANHAWTAFGPTNVAVHELSIRVELGDLSAAALATPLPVGSDLPVERQVRHDLEVARVWSATGRETDAVDLVTAARRRAPDQVHHHFLTRAMVDAWLHRPVAGRPEVRALARDLSSARREHDAGETAVHPNRTRDAGIDEKGHARS